MDYARIDCATSNGLFIELVNGEGVMEPNTSVYVNSATVPVYTLSFSSTHMTEVSLFCGVLSSGESSCEMWEHS